MRYPWKRFAILMAASLVAFASAATRPPIPVNKPPPRVKTASIGSGIVPATVNLTLSWDYPVLELSPDLTFRIYHTTNILSPAWELMTNVVGVTIATVPVVPGNHYFAVATYSTFWGVESPFSEAAATPPAPRSGTNLTLKR